MSCVLEIKGLSFSYPDGRRALSDIDLRVTSGEKLGLVGPNGAGKSTLLLHLNGILRGEGEIAMCHHEVPEDNGASLRTHVGLVFQDPDDQLFSPTVFEDVAYGPMYMGLAAPEVRLRVEQALGAVGMQGLEDRVPHRMSLGEKKQVAIATVLAMKPEILALDEPTAALDARSRRRIIQVLRSLKQTVIVATHDLGLVAEILGRTVVLDGGQIVFDGPTDSLMAEKGFLIRHGLEAP